MDGSPLYTGAGSQPLSFHGSATPGPWNRLHPSRRGKSQEDCAREVDQEWKGPLSLLVPIPLSRAPSRGHPCLQRYVGDVVQLCAQEEEGMVLNDNLCHKYFLRPLGIIADTA